uniref:Uncharacterized protein n=1 Tax=Rhizophagus irregularis (strain DAOM 181602 / DAOM 197198 / MUCL 43194) TaxID=747089 RepID=U9U6D1_RHIID
MFYELTNDKIHLLFESLIDLQNLHELGYLHKDLHSGNIIQSSVSSYILEFGLSGPANEQKSNDKNLNERPRAEELKNIFRFWYSIKGNNDEK